jgi:hypothetical protein
VAIAVSESESRREVDYYIYAENSTQTREYLPPNAPTGYFYYTVYNHSICNFLVVSEFRTLLGSSDLIMIEVRNIQHLHDNITLTLTSWAKFLDADVANQQTVDVLLNPREEKMVYARMIPAAEEFTLVLTGHSNLADPYLWDQDNITISIGFPPNFSELSDLSIAILILLAGLIYFKCIRGKNQN